jgi:hypothetical protein
MSSNTHQDAWHLEEVHRGWGEQAILTPGVIVEKRVEPSGSVEHYGVQGLHEERQEGDLVEHFDPDAEWLCTLEAPEYEMDAQYTESYGISYDQMTQHVTAQRWVQVDVVDGQVMAESHSWQGKVHSVQSDFLTEISAASSCVADTVIFSGFSGTYLHP